MEYDSNIKLSDLISTFFIEEKLPFYLKPNALDPRILAICKKEWPKDFAPNMHDHIGHISNRRNMACMGIAGHESEWIDARNPDFFVRFREILDHVRP